MNDLMKEAVGATDTQWAAIFAMFTFLTVFVGGLVVALRAPKTPPQWE